MIFKKKKKLVKNFSILGTDFVSILAVVIVKEEIL